MPDRYELVFEASGFVTTDTAPTPEPAPEPENASTTDQKEQDR